MNQNLEIEKLYHITLGTPSYLEPRIPKNRLKNEDSVIPRICVCPTIEDCFKSVPWAVNYYEKGKYEGLDRELVRVLEFDVYNVGNENIISNDYIVRNNLVYDAQDTNEFWIINKPIKADRVYYIYPGCMDYAYLMDHACLGVDLSSYLKIDEDAISEETVARFNGIMYPWELNIDDSQVTKIFC